jgi:hypothetical protein
MMRFLDLFRFAPIAVAGWMNRQQMQRITGARISIGGGVVQAGH